MTRKDGRHVSLAAPHSSLVSLSRCGEAAVVALSPVGGVGVDIERVGRRLLPAAHTYLRPAELRRLRGPTAAMQATALWAVKEAVLKALGVGLTVPPIRVRLRPGVRRGRRRWHWRTPAAQGSALTWRRGPYVLAVAVLQ